MISIIFLLKYLALLAGMVLTSYSPGARLYKLFIPSQEKERLSLERFFFSTCLGLVCWSYLLFALGCVHLLYKPVFILFFVLTILLFAVDSRHFEWQQIGKAISRWDKRLIALLIVGGIPVFLKALFPAVGWDDTMYHLSLCREFLTAHWITPTPFLRYIVFNQFTDLLFVPLWALGGDCGAQQLSVASFLLCGLGIFSFLRKQVSADAGLLGFAVWMSSKLVFDLSCVAYVDMNLALMGLAAVYAGLNMVCAEDVESKRKYACLTGLFLGCTVASKISSAWLAIFFPLSIYLVRAKQVVKDRASVANALQEIGRVALSCFIVVAPWLIRSAWVTGNPVWPFAWSIFGLGPWTQRDYVIEFFDLCNPRGLSRNVINLFLTPWFLSYSPAGFQEPPLIPFLFPAVLLGVFAFVRRQKDTVLLRILLMTIVCCFIAWFSSTHVTRYLLFVAPAICIVAGWVFFLLFATIKSEKLRSWVVGLAVLISLCIGVLQQKYVQLICELPQLPTDRLSRQYFLADKLPLYPAFAYMNLLPKKVLYRYNCENMAYFYDGVSIGDVFGPGRYFEFEQSLAYGATLYAHLKKLGVSYLLLNKAQLNHPMPEDDFFKQHFKVIYNDKFALVYVIT